MANMQELDCSAESSQSDSDHYVLLTSHTEAGHRICQVYDMPDIREQWRLHPEAKALGSSGVMRIPVDDYESARQDLADCLRLAGIEPRVTAEVDVLRAEIKELKVKIDQQQEVIKALGAVLVDAD